MTPFKYPTNLLFYFSKLPYDVTGAQALEHQEVKDKLHETIKSLGEVANRFLTHIVGSVEKIP